MRTVFAYEVQVGQAIITHFGAAASRVTAVRPHGDTIVLVTKDGTTVWSSNESVRVAS